MAESTGLENRRRETVPGFESLPLRHFCHRPIALSHPQRFTCLLAEIPDPHLHRFAQ